MSPSIRDCLERLPRTAKEAREKGVLHYFTGKPCKRGHVVKRHVSDRTCIECTKRWKEANPDKVREAIRRWKEENPDKAREAVRRWKKANQNKERERKRRWSEANPDKNNAKEARRRATKKNATPSWANQEKIKRFYTKSKEFEQSTGLKHHVDHIYPLKSDFLCGLHVESNLQILTAEENCSKHNREWPGQLPCQFGRGADHDWWRKLNERIQSPSTSGGLSL